MKRSVEQSVLIELIEKKSISTLKQMWFGNQSRCMESEQRNETDSHAWLVGALITVSGLLQ